MKKNLILFSIELDLSMIFSTFDAIHKSTLRKIFFPKNPLKINSGNRNLSVFIKIPNDLKDFNNDMKSYLKRHEKSTHAVNS